MEKGWHPSPPFTSSRYFILALAQRKGNPNQDLFHWTESREFEPRIVQVFVPTHDPDYPGISQTHTSPSYHAHTQPCHAEKENWGISPPLSYPITISIGGGWDGCVKKSVMEWTTGENSVSPPWPWLKSEKSVKVESQVGENDPNIIGYWTARNASNRTFPFPFEWYTTNDNGAGKTGLHGGREPL